LSHAAAARTNRLVAVAPLRAAHADATAPHAARIATGPYVQSLQGCARVPCQSPIHFHVRAVMLTPTSGAAR
jgi:hypothetical protein